MDRNLRRRRQLSLFAPEPARSLIDAVRAQVDPSQLAIIPAHVTLCRQEDLRDWKRVRTELSSLSDLKIRMQFGPPWQGEDGAIFLPAIQDTEAFDALRRTLMRVEGEKPRSTTPHITLLHPRNAPVDIARLKMALEFRYREPIVFDEVSVIEQRASNGERQPWRVVDRFPRPADERFECVAQTERLVMRRLTPRDAEFIVGLLNEPSFLRFIGDRGVRSLDDAAVYLNDGPLESYRRHGFGLYLVELKRVAAESGLSRPIHGQEPTPIGICGLLKRDTLNDVDLGFAFRPAFWTRGYATEAASAMIAHARDDFRLGRLVAITNPDNEASIRVLEKLGMTFRETLSLVEDGPTVRLYEMQTS